MSAELASPWQVKCIGFPTPVFESTSLRYPAAVSWPPVVYHCRERTGWHLPSHSLTFSGRLRRCTVQGRSCRHGKFHQEFWTMNHKHTRDLSCPKDCARSVLWTWGCEDTRTQSSRRIKGLNSFQNCRKVGYRVLWKLSSGLTSSVRFLGSSQP